MKKHSIKSVRYYDCGYCINQMAFVYKGHRFENRKFPSGVFLLKHPTQGYVLYDTGYSRDIYNNGIKGKLYKTFNPTFVKKEDEILSQLHKDGVDPKDIRYVILSHLHPDHIGGLKFFKNSTIIITEGINQTHEDPRPSDLVFQRMLPEWLKRQRMVISNDQLQQTEIDGLRGYDLFKDGSLLLVELAGHARGHLGAYIPSKILLAGDASWGDDLLESADKLSIIARHVQHDYDQYVRLAGTLEKLRDSGVRMCFSHDVYKSKELLP